MCSVGSLRYCEANNKYMPEYDKTKPFYFLNYFDANNLYGYAMKLPLPTGKYKWEKPEEFSPEIISKADYMNGTTGYIFDVNLEYPKELHDLHSDYPLALELCKNEPSLE